MSGRQLPTPSLAPAARPRGPATTADDSPAPSLEVVAGGLDPDQRGLAGGAETAPVIRSQPRSEAAGSSSGAAAVASGSSRRAPSWRPSRSVAARRRELVKSVRRGSASGLRHGAFATVANLPDVASEVALTFELHPSLDRLRDLRFVEHYAMTQVRLRRIEAAIDASDQGPHLMAALLRISPLAERLEAQLRELVDRRVSARNDGAEDVAARYRSGPNS